MEKNTNNFQFKSCTAAKENEIVLFFTLLTTTTKGQVVL